MKEELLDKFFKVLEKRMFDRANMCMGIDAKSMILDTLKEFNIESAKPKNIDNINFFEASKEVINIINSLNQDDINRYKDDEVNVVRDALMYAISCIKRHLDTNKKRILVMIGNRPVKRKIEDMSKEELVAYIKENML